MKKLMFILLLCGCIVLMCACTEQTDAAPDSFEAAAQALSEAPDGEAGKALPPSPAPVSRDAQTEAKAADPLPAEAAVGVPAATEEIKADAAIASAPATRTPDQAPAATAPDTPEPIEALSPGRASHTPAPQPEQPSPFDPILKLDFVIEKPEEPKQPQITCAPEPTPALDWPYPQITCPPEPTPTAVLDWPHPSITCPPESSPAPEPTAPAQAPVVQPSAAPVLPDAPAAPAPEQPPVPEPAPDPAPTPMPEPAVTPKPSGGYAVCSCGAKLMPDELVAHMKAHALNGESHSYVAY